MDSYFDYLDADCVIPSTKHSAMKVHSLFVDNDLDLMETTGTDLFNLALSASFGGKHVHGVSSAAACETISKSTEDFCSVHAHARIMSVENPTFGSKVGPMRGDSNDAKREFRGFVTTPFAEFLTDTGAWEPAAQGRAKNLSMLVGLMTNSGMSAEDACAVGELISGSPVPLNTPNLVSVRSSAPRHVAASVAKRSHSVFSRTEFQSTVMWDDTHLHVEALPEAAAFDWARAVVIGRYIAESNIRIDPRFEEYARHIGVPYVIIRGAWAVTTLSDFLVRPPERGKSHYVSENICPSITKSLERMDDINRHAVARAREASMNSPKPFGMDDFVQVLSSMRQLRDTRTIGRGTDVLAPITTIRFTAATASDYVAKTGSAKDTLVEALAFELDCDPALKLAYQRVVLVGVDKGDRNNGLEVALRHLSSPGIWHDAALKLAQKLGTSVATTAMDRMARLKRSLFGTSTALTSPIGVTPAIRSAFKSWFPGIAREVLVGKGPSPPAVREIKQRMEGAAPSTRQQLMALASGHFSDYRLAWADRYESWARHYADMRPHGWLEQSVCYGAAANAFRTLQVTTLVNAEQGFTPAEGIFSSYMWSQAVSYARKRVIEFPTHGISNASGLDELATLLDAYFNPTVSFVEVQKWVCKRLSDFAQDMIGGTDSLEPAPPQAVGSEFPEPPMSPVPGLVGEMTPEELEAFIASMMGESSGPPAKPSLEKVLATYESPEQAELHAAANGYACYADAYEALGEKARFDEMSEYTAKGAQLEMQGANIAGYEYDDAEEGAMF